MGVNMSAAGDRLDGFADGPSIFDDGFVFWQIAQGDFVTQRNVIEQFDFTRRLTFKSDSANGGSLFQIKDGDADIVLGFMQ